MLDKPTARALAMTRETIEADVAAFLASGRQITVVPPGATGVELVTVEDLEYTEGDDEDL